MKTYIYGNSQVLAQHNGPHTAAKYFYLHDRLGSVRQIINTSGLVQKYYTYEPFGQSVESGGTFADPFRFTGQFYDEEIAEYYLRARQYNPTIARFTARDPVFGKLEQPLTLHKYLYCGNDSVNRIDAAGLRTYHIQASGTFSAGFSMMYQIGFVKDDDGNWGTMITHNDPTNPDLADRDWKGSGVGLPSASFGVAVGVTTADTIFDLEGPGINVGGSFTVGPGWGFTFGADYLQGIQRNGEYYYGAEVFLGGGAGALPYEAHGHYTWTNKIIPWNSGDQQALGMAQEYVESTLFSCQTVGQSYLLLEAWANLQ